MKLSTVFASVIMAPVVMGFNAPSSGVRTESRLAETKSDIQAKAKQLNPFIGYFDPLGLTDSNMYGQSEEFTIGWLRQSEIKHGRVAMAAFVGYIAQSNYVFPWSLTRAGDAHPGVDLSPPEQWDALPFASKLQIILFVGFLEWYSELTPEGGAQGGQIHYTKGGQPGKFPSFDAIPHPVPFNLYDPFGRNENMSDETKERRLLAEINNGRLAMLGIFAFLSAQVIEGSVPLLANIVKPYSGNIMAPFEADFTL